MKRIVGFMMVLFMLLSLTACGRDSSVTTTEDTIQNSETQLPTSNTAESEKTVIIVGEQMDSTNILVVYFSRTGTTEPLAEYAADYLNADVFEIEAAVPYTDEDIAYYTDCRADREQDDKSARPEIACKVDNMEQYDTIIIGYPIWHGQAPRIIDTFMESYDFDGKTIVPFCTSHSSGIGGSDTYLHDLVSGDVSWKDGRRFEGGTSKDTITSWLDELGIQPYVKDASSNATGGEVEVGKFDFENKSVLLNSGYYMPINGIGTYSLLDDTCVASVKEALKDGVRLIDTAYMYHNEEEVSQAIREAMDEYGIKREDIFVISGSSNPDHILENTKLYDFELTDEEMAEIKALNRDEKHDWH